MVSCFIKFFVLTVNCNLIGLDETCHPARKVVITRKQLYYAGARHSCVVLITLLVLGVKVDKSQGTDRLRDAGRLVLPLSRVSLGIFITYPCPQVRPKCIPMPNRSHYCSYLTILDELCELFHYPKYLSSNFIKFFFSFRT